MKNNFIKIYDEKTAQTLIASGFSYAIERQNNSKVYVFPSDEKILKFINKNFKNNGFVREKKLRF